MRLKKFLTCTCIAPLVLFASCFACVDYGWRLEIQGEVVDSESGNALAGFGVTFKLFEEDVQVWIWNSDIYFFDERAFTVHAGGLAGGTCAPLFILPLASGSPKCPQVDRIELTIRRLGDDLETLCREEVFEILVSDGVLTQESQCNSTFRLTEPIAIGPCPD